MPPTAARIESATGPTGADVVELAAHGDAAAFDAIALWVGDNLYRRAMAILREEADACDATQEALIRAWRELPKLASAVRFDAWLDRILVNLCRDLLRSRGRQQVREIRPSPDPDATGSSDARSDPHASDDRREAIEWAFRQLSIEDRTLLVLHHLERRPVADLAAVLAIPAGTVTRRLHTARGRLQGALDRESSR
jgi:RNA polymerase sigma-70 factor (ECF subfamily)